MTLTARQLAPFCAGMTRSGAHCSRGAAVPEGAPKWCRRHDPDAKRPARVTGPALGHAVPLYAEPTDRAEWLAKRIAYRGIGASEVYRVLYGDRLRLALEFRGDAERPDLDDVREVQRGNDAEPFILAWAGAEKPGWVYRHPEHACLTCTPDGVTSEGVIVEAKFTHGWNRESVVRFINHGVEAVWGYAPAKWWVQCQVQMAVTGLPVELAVMVGTDSLADCWAGRGPVEGDMYRIPVERDDAVIAVIEREIPAFHALFIVGDDTPTPGPVDADLRAVSDAWCVEHGLVVEAPDLADAVERLVTQGEARKSAAKVEDAAKREIKARLIGSRAEVLTVGAREVRADARGALQVKERRES